MDAYVDAYVDTVDSPVGVIAFATGGDGSLLAVKFLDGESPRALTDELEGEGFLIHPAAGDSGPDAGAGRAGRAGTTAPTVRARTEITEYFGGARRSFDVPLVLHGSEFQQHVWAELLRIPFGETRSYADIARGVGKPGAYRAVGRANATNRIPLVIPCHRVIGSDGTLTGYGGGLGVKQRLLSFEGAPRDQGRSQDRSQGPGRARGRDQRTDVIPGLEIF